MNPTESDLWRRDLGKIDRRLGRDDLDEDQRAQLWALRHRMFDAGRVDNLDRRLREIEAGWGRSIGAGDK